VELSARQGEPTHFLTLTIRRTEDGSPLEARRIIGRKFPLLMRRAARRLGVDRIPYQVVIEAHKSGWPHLHALLRCSNIPHAFLSATWKELTGSHVVWIERVSNARNAARYVAKYLGKDLKRFGTFKRYWSSRDWLVNQGDPEAETWRREVWTYTREQVDDVLRRLMRDGFHVVPHTGRHGEHVAMRPAWRDAAAAGAAAFSHLRDNAVQSQAPPNKELAA
jgi:hypothetical protein